MNPKELENVMVAKQVAQSFTNQWEAIEEYLKAIAKTKRHYFLACQSEGFTAQEALYLTGLFQLLNSGNAQ